jgi:hypothetical protein
MDDEVGETDTAVCPHRRPIEAGDRRYGRFPPLDFFHPAMVRKTRRFRLGHGHETGRCHRAASMVQSRRVP